MKKVILSIIVCILSAGAANAQNILKSLANTAVSQAKFTAHSNAASAVSKGVSSVMSGNIFGKKKNTSKGTDEALVSYLNPEVGFKGQYPKSYTREDIEDQVTFTSSDGTTTIAYCGKTGTAIENEYQSTLDEVNANYELLESKLNADEGTIKYNTGGVIVTVHFISKGDRVAIGLMAYPEDEATSYKKLVNNIQKSLQFFK